MTRLMMIALFLAVPLAGCTGHAGVPGHWMRHGGGHWHDPGSCVGALTPQPCEDCDTDVGRGLPDYPGC